MLTITRLAFCLARFLTWVLSQAASHCEEPPKVWVTRPPSDFIIFLLAQCCNNVYRKEKNWQNFLQGLLAGWGWREWRLTQILRADNRYLFKCSRCQSSDIAVDNNGKAGLVQHFKSKKHKDIANLRSGRVSYQIIFDIQTDENENASATINDEEVDDNGLIDGEGVPVPSNRDKRGIKSLSLVRRELALFLPTSEWTLTIKLLVLKLRLLWRL